MRVLGNAPSVPDEKQLLSILRETVEKIVREDVPPDVEPERIWALRQAQKADFYWRGIQYLSPKFLESGLITYGATGAPVTSGEGKNGSVDDDYIINIFRGYGRKFVAVLGSRLPNVKAVPDDPDDEDALRRTRMADIAANILRSQWDMEMRHMELALRLYKDSTAFIYTPWVTDGEKYGQREEPKMEARQVQNGPEMWRCAQCGMESAEPVNQCLQCGSTIINHEEASTISVPEVVGSAKYDNGAVEMHICNIFTVTTPFWIKDLDDAPWLSYEYDEYRGRLIKIFPDLRHDARDQPGSTDSASEQLAKQVRDSAASPIGVPNPHRESRWNYRRLWLKTFMYELVQDDELRQLLYQHYPRGLKVTMVNGKIKKLEDEKLTDVWVVCKPEASEYIYADGIGYDMMPVQDLKNDVLNLSYRTFEGGLGMNFVDPRAINVDEWDRRKRKPNELIPILPEFGQALADAFYQVPPANMNPQIYGWMDALENDGRVAIGTTEAIYGGMVSQESTAHEAELRKNAALQQLGITYLFVRKADEKVYMNGVRQLSRFGSGTLKMSKRKRGEDGATGSNGYEKYMLDVSQLKEDGWHFESEEAFPMTHAERRAYLMWALGNPTIAQGLGVAHPRNIVKNQALLGLTDYYAEGVDDHYKAQEVIAELLKSPPIQKPQPDGSVDTQPSIPIDDFDNHSIMAQEAYSWCKSHSGRTEQRENIDGFANVVAWGLAHMKAAQPPKELPPPKLSISAKATDLGPDAAAQVLGDFGVELAPGSVQPPPPKQESKEPPAEEGKPGEPPKMTPPSMGVSGPPSGPPPPGAPPTLPALTQVQ